MVDFLLTGGGGSSGLDSLNWKNDVYVRASTNVNLAAPGASLDGQAMSLLKKRFIAAGQTVPAENGIYDWNGALVPATRSSDANTADELLNATTTVEAGTSAGTTWRQSTAAPITVGVTALAFSPFGAGDVVGPGSSTDNALAVMSGVTGKLIKNSLAILSLAGALSLPAGSAANPAFSPLANAGLYATGVANEIALSTNNAARLTVNTAAITAALPVLSPSGGVGGPGIAVGELTTGWWLNTTGILAASLLGANKFQLSASSNDLFVNLGALGTGINYVAALASSTEISLRGSITTTAQPGTSLRNANVFTGSTTSQVGALIVSGVTQTSGAGFTSLKLMLGSAIAGTGTPTFGSTGGFFIDAQSNSVSVFQVTAAGAVRAVGGTAANPGLGLISTAGMGWYDNTANTFAVSIGSAQVGYFYNGGLRFTALGTGVSQVAASALLLAGGATTGSTFALAGSNFNVFTGGAGAAQGGLSLSFGVNQTSTASYRGIRQDLGLVVAGTGVPVFGSGGGFFEDYYANSVQMFSIKSGGDLFWKGNQQWGVTAANNAGSPYTYAAGIGGYSVDVSGGAITLNLPAASASTIGLMIPFSDLTNQFGTNNFTIHPAGTDKIDNTNANKVIATNGFRGFIWCVSATAWVIFNCP